MAAQQLYASLGFIETERLRGYYGSVAALELHKALEPRPRRKRGRWMSTNGQATVLETPRDHEPPFWCQHISGNPYSSALDAEELLPPMTELQRKSCRSGRPVPIATAYWPQRPL